MDPTGYMMSEKLDGMRAYWDGKSFYSRQGNMISVPAFFSRDFPTFALDGELWSGYNDFQRCVGIVKGQKEYKQTDWGDIRYLVFDAPNQKGTFKQRYTFLKDELSTPSNPYIVLVDHKDCKGSQHLQDCLQQVLDKGGEGLMLRDPQSLYEGKRSTTLLKVKRFDEMEAKVVGHEKGKGRLSSLTGKLQCQLPSGVLFYVGSGFSDKERIHPPKIGSIVTIQHQGLTITQKPRFPIFLRRREDVSWDDLCLDYKLKDHQTDPNVASQRQPVQPTQQMKRKEKQGKQDKRDKHDTTHTQVACKYGAQCYRQNPKHLKLFSHPDFDPDLPAGSNPSEWE